ncbi:SH3 domain-containing protein 19 [Stegastes partitus]|uniref:SH3 domain-containing protein 19 n=1 Tax=Stegastes partitus TaxID=144197 RepID=A0A9Y4JYS0_9TELE|nr:PREDICTED: SH3 domain-containing protein 19 [Stegastes partitus]
MAEARREEEEEEDDGRDLRDRNQTTDRPERTKPEHLHCSQGPLSSIRAAIKRTRTNSQSDNTRDRRRPEITIVSAEPLANNNWFSGTSVVLPPPQSGWSAGITAVSQVIKEKTQEEHIVKPTAAPRRTCCTATSATQTDPVREDASTTVPQCTATPPLAEKRPAGKKPQKPPRPSLPKAANRKPEATETEEKFATNTAAVTNTEDQSDSKSDVKPLEKAASTHTCTRSVTVHWNIPTNPLSVTAETTSSSNSEHSQPPVPRPRTKTQKQAIKEEAAVQTLVKLSENCDNIQSDPQEVSSNKYLKELLEVFSADIEGEENSDVVDQSDEASHGEDAAGEMNDSHSQRNIRARIQAFESQVSTEDGNSELVKPEPRPRKATTRPPVAAKPSVALRPQFSQSIDDDNQNISATNTPQYPPQAPRPLPPKKPVGLSIKEELESIHSRGTLPQRSRPSVLTRANSIHDEELSPVPPVPPVKPFKEPLKPNLNINNHNSSSMFRENEYVDSSSNHVPVKPQHSVDSNGGSFTRQSLTKRPTTIRVPSKTGSMSDNFQDSPPPLPTQKPVGSLTTSVNRRQSLTPSLSLQDSFSTGPQPSLPPRKPSVKKTLPPRPPPAKAGPGRPPPPSRSHSATWETSPKPQTHKPHRKPILPPRPKPGHRLYNNYTLQLPHGIGAFDYNGSHTGELSFQKNEVLLLLEQTSHDEFECQIGDIRGRVHKSRMKIITPLDSDMSPAQGAGPAASGGDGYGMKVQALHDFTPEGPGELALRAGDVVTMVEQVDGEWYRGTCRGSAGFFPINYVKVLSNSPRPLPEKKPKPPPASVSGPRCVARFDFEGEHSDELSFSEGDVIKLKEYVGQDWARGQIGASTGIFPLNFVEVIEDLSPPPSQQQSAKIALPGMAAATPSTHSEPVKPAQASQSGVEWVVAVYDYAGNSEDDLSFQQGDCILIIQHLNAEWSCGRLNGREGMFPRAFVEAKTDPQLSNNQQNGAAGGARARALYDFTSNCDEELSLQVGDIVTNLESVDEEWFSGELRGKRALVPKNYVQVLG